MVASSIGEVIELLSVIIDDCWQINSRLGYFPAMYRKVTAQIMEGVRTGRFENPEQIEHLDVVFANLYLEAYYRHRQGSGPRNAWRYAFDMADEEYPMIVQHLLLGMNAHINLDLAIAAAQVTAGRELEGLKQDFFEVNRVLSGLLDEVQSGVNDSSPLYRLLDRLGWRIDEAICNFSIRQARRAAWRKARLLHQTPAHIHGKQIERIDQEVTRLARRICPPSRKGNAIFLAISDSETQEPREIIEELA